VRLAIARLLKLMLLLWLMMSLRTWSSDRAEI